jgi:hypothetical protein
MRFLSARAGSAAISVLALLLLGVPGGTLDAHGAVAHRWVVYGGRQDGVRIVFELNGHRLTPASVSIPIACSGGHRPHAHFLERSNRHFPIRVDRDGRFHEDTERSEVNGSERKTIVGQVTPKKIEGKIAVSFSERARVGIEECHSGKHPHGPTEELSFRAYRHRSRP